MKTATAFGIMLILGGLFLSTQVGLKYNIHSHRDELYNPYSTLGWAIVALGSLIIVATTFSSDSAAPSGPMKPFKAWCGYCKKYVTGTTSLVNIWQIPCPECGHKGMTTLSPEDR